MAEQTATTSKVPFILGELHRGGGANSQSSGASRESFISGESMLLGRGRGRGVHPAETPAPAPHGSGGQEEPHGPQPGMSGKCGEPVPGSSGDSRELKKANEKIKDLEGQVDSLVGIQNNLEIEMETQRVLVQEYEEDLRKMKHDNATVKAQLLTSEKKNGTLERLLLEAQGKLREAGSDELDHWRKLAESRKDESTLLQASLEAYKRALNDQVKNYHRLHVYTLAIERHYQEAALNILTVRLPRPEDLLPQLMPISVVPIPAMTAAPVVVTMATPPVMTAPPVMTTPPITMVPAITTARVEATSTTTTSFTSRGEPDRLRASGSGVLRAAMVNRPLIPGPSITTIPVVFPTPMRVPIAAGGKVHLTRVIRQAVPMTSGIVRPVPRVTPLMPILPASLRARMSMAVGVMSGGVVTPSV